MISTPIEVKKHPEDRNKLHLVLLVFLLQELKEYVLEIYVVHRWRRRPAVWNRRTRPAFWARRGKLRS